MSPQEQWQISGNAPEAYERYMVPTLFTRGPQILLNGCPFTLASMCWMWPVGRVSWHAFSTPRQPWWNSIGPRS
jgi:hypothetical protein